MRTAVLASGSGTLLDAILSDGIAVDLVVVDRVCVASEVAAKHGVPAVVQERTDFTAGFDRDAFSAETVDILTGHDIDLVVMAGWGTIFGAPVFEAFHRRIINTHPALLPAFKGWHAVPQALDYGVKVTGCTVHVATVEVDEGPILAQAAVDVLPDDTVESLHERIKAVERELYPATIRAVLASPEILDSTPAPVTPDSHKDQR